MRRSTLIWLLVAAGPVVGCNTPTAPADGPRVENTHTVLAVPVQKRPVHLKAPIHLR